MSLSYKGEGITQDVELSGGGDGLGALGLHEHRLHLLHAPAHHRPQPPRHRAHRRPCARA